MDISCNPTPCRTPENLSTHFLELNYNFNNSHNSFPENLISSYYENTRISYDGIFTRRGSSCPLFVPSSGSIQDRSLCPWYYRANRNPRRYPATILEAVPRCTNCVGTSGNGRHICERLYRSLKVLIRQDRCNNGQYVYVERTEEFAIASLCAQRREIVSARRYPPYRRVVQGSNDVLSM